MPERVKNASRRARSSVGAARKCASATSSATSSRASRPR